MRSRVEGYARAAGRAEHRIGCIMVAQPTFFADGEWVDQPRDWKPNVVSGAGYDLSLGEGLRIWEACKRRTLDLPLPLPIAADGDLRAPRFGPPQLVAPRLGQGTFRVAVTGAYRGACAVSGEHSLPVLEAAHIRPYGRDGSHDVANGLLLRADIHRLFDSGYVTVTPEHRFLVSQRLAEQWENGKAYYALHGTVVTIPTRAGDKPDSALLRWHNETVFERDAA